MSFGREALKKTLEQLKKNVFSHIESLLELSKSHAEKYKEMTTELKQASENIQKARDTKERLEAISKLEKIRHIQQEASFNMEMETRKSQTELMEILVLYVSALENYALEFDKTWDNLIEQIKKQREKTEETTKELRKINLSYIK